PAAAPRHQAAAGGDRARRHQQHFAALGAEARNQGGKGGGVVPAEVAAAVGQQAAADLDHGAPPGRQRLFGKRMGLWFVFLHGSGFLLASWKCWLPAGWRKSAAQARRTGPRTCAAETRARKTDQQMVRGTQTIGNDHKRSAARERTRSRAWLWGSAA